MKKIIQYLNILLLLLILSACNNFLEVEPLDRVPASQVFSDINGIKVLLANLYNQMPIEDFNYNPDKGFDDRNTPTGFSMSFMTDESLRTTGPGIGPIKDNYWNYIAIRQVNQFLETLSTVKMDSTQRNRLESEAHFIRGYMYFALARRYGGVPIIEKVLDYEPGTENASLFIPRSTEKETWDFILKECDLAAKNLPLNVSSDEGIYRATKWAALALKSRAALHAASVAKYWNSAPLVGEAVDKMLAGGMSAVDADNYYQQCIDASNTIIASSGKMLYKPNPANPSEATINYKSIFENPAIADAEVIFKRGYIDGSATKKEQGHSMDLVFQPSQGQPGVLYYGRFSPTLDLADLYPDYTDDGTGISKPFITRTDGKEDVIADPATLNVSLPFKYYDNLIDIFANKDARLYASFILPGSVWKGITIVMQAGMIKPNGTKVFYNNDNAVGKDGKTYYALGAESSSGFSGFLSVGASTNQNFSSTGFGLKKFLQEGKNVQGILLSSTTDFIDFRLAEIYLNYAEATIESGKGDAVLAENYLNAIRKRAAHKDIIPATLGNILKERRIELAFEGMRYWDLVRRREFHTVFSSTRRTSLLPIIDLRQPIPKYIFVRVNNYYDQKSNGRSFSRSGYYRQIPEVNTSKLVQNPID